MRSVATLVAVIAFNAQAFAQSPGLPRVAIGGGVTLASADADARMRLGSEARGRIDFADVSGRVARRVAIGAEAIDLGRAAGETAGQSFRSTGEQRERAVLGVVRVRAGGGGRIALDVMTGAGMLFQRHTASFAPCFRGCAVASTSELTRRASAFVVGADVPIQLGRHFALAAIGRYYFLNRGDHQPAGPGDVLPWQFEYHSSSRVGVGGAARVIW